MNIVFILLSIVGGVLGALKNQKSGKCVNFYLDRSVKAILLGRGCETLFKLLPNGNIKEHGSENVCIGESRSILAAIDCPANGDISFTTKGAISRPDPEADRHSRLGYICFYLLTETTVTIGYNPEFNHCDERRNFFEFLGKCRSC